MRVFNEKAHLGNQTLNQENGRLLTKRQHLQIWQNLVHSPADGAKMRKTHWFKLPTQARRTQVPESRSLHRKD